MAKDTVGDFIDSSQKDTKEFFDSIKDDLEKWTKMLIDKKISNEDYKDLVEAKKELAKIRALTQTGIAAAKVELFKSGLVNLITNTAKSMF